jgi:hypothetical protein
MKCLLILHLSSTLYKNILISNCLLMMDGLTFKSFWYTMPAEDTNTLSLQLSVTKTKRGGHMCPRRSQIIGIVFL